MTADPKPVALHVRHEGRGLLSLFRDDEFVREIGVATAWDSKDRDEFIARYNEHDALRAEVAELRKANDQLAAHGTALYARAQRAEAQAAELAEALEVAREYVQTELACEKERFAGHLHCSTVASIESDLQQIDAALARAGKGEAS